MLKNYLALGIMFRFRKIEKLFFFEPKRNVFSVFGNLFGLESFLKIGNP